MNYSNVHLKDEPVRNNIMRSFIREHICSLDSDSRQQQASPVARPSRHCNLSKYIYFHCSLNYEFSKPVVISSFDSYVFFIFRLKDFFSAVIFIYAVSVAFQLAHLQISTPSTCRIAKRFDTAHQVGVMSLDAIAKKTGFFIRRFP